MGLQGRLGISHSKLLQVIGLMEGYLEEPLARAELARRAGLSSRQLERLFRRYLGRTPTRYYLELRLHRASALLTPTSMSILNVALRSEGHTSELQSLMRCSYAVLCVKKQT